LFFASSRLQSTSFNSYLRPSSSVARPCSLILSRSPVSIKSRRLVPSKKYSYEAQLELYSQWLRTQRYGTRNNTISWAPIIELLHPISGDRYSRTIVLLTIFPVHARVQARRCWRWWCR
jgi:hypothetical protein